MSENRRLEASVEADDRGPFPAKWGGENAETSRGFALYEDSDLSVVVRRLETAGKWRSDERESPRLCYGMNACMVHRYR